MAFSLIFWIWTQKILKIFLQKYSIIYYMITSIGNSQVKNVEALQKKSRERREQRCFVAEGLRLILETPGQLLKELYVTDTFAASEDGAAAISRLRSRSPRARFETVSDQVMGAMSDTQTPQGVLGVVEMPFFTLHDTITSATRRNIAPQLLILETIQDPGNLGTILRTAEGAGVTGVVMNNTTVDIYSPKVVRSTMGSIFRLPHVVVPDLEKAVHSLKAVGVRIYAAHLHGEANYDRPDYTSACGFLIGNEGNGLTSEAASWADELIKIPMEGRLESLNAAMAAGILSYEVHRQRANAGRI